MCVSNLVLFVAENNGTVGHKVDEQPEFCAETVCLVCKGSLNLN